MPVRPGSFVSRLATLALALALAGPALAQELPSTITTRFDPRVDGFRVENLGDTSNPDGNCWGISLLAIDAYRRRMAQNGADLAPGYVAQQFPNEVDAARQATAGLVQETLNTTMEIPTLPALSDPSQIRAALERINATGVPEVLFMETPGRAEGHAVVLHGYRDGALQLYDSNFPNQTIAWPWNPLNGFGTHPAAEPGNFYDNLSGATARAFDDHPLSEFLPELEAACSTGEGPCVDRYAPLTSTTRLGPDGLVVRGQVGTPPGGGARPDKVYLVVNGITAAAAVPTRFGTFSLPTIPARALRGDGTDVVRVVSQQGRVFAGFGNVTLPPAEAIARAIAAARTPARGTSRAPSAPAPTRGLTGALGSR